MKMYYESELYHHGILGQKWGVRRYQNEDGSYTEAGKKRYGKSSSSQSDDYKNAHNVKDTSTLSDQELRTVINRLSMEQQYSDLKTKSNVIVKGSSYVATAATVVGTFLNLYNNSDKLISTGKKFISKLKK